MFPHLPDTTHGIIFPQNAKSVRPARNLGLRTIPREMAAFIDTSSTFGRNIFQGILDYQRRFAPHWHLVFPETNFSANRFPREFSHWTGDGVIIRSESPDFVREAARHASFVLDIGDEHHFGFPTVYYDHQKVAQRAVEHFASQQLRYLLYVGLKQRGWSAIRAEGFFEEARSLGLRPSMRLLTDSPDAAAYEKEQAQLEILLKKLPKPLGVFTCSDRLAVRLLEVTKKMKYLVPAEVAILGSDNETQLCESVFPAISSLATDGHVFGYESAKYFDGILRGTETPCRLPMLVPPGKIFVRQSSNTDGMQDAQLLSAMKLIRDKACLGLRVEDISAATGLPRRTLERKFNQILKRSPHAEILRVQVETTQRLLAETAYPLEEIARLAGFRSVSHLCISLKRAIRKTPSEFRQEAVRAEENKPYV